MRSKNILRCEIGGIFDEAQEQFLVLKFNSAAKDKFKVLDLEAFGPNTLPFTILLLRHTNKFRVYLRHTYFMKAKAYLLHSLSLHTEIIITSI